MSKKSLTLMLKIFHLTSFIFLLCAYKQCWIHSIHSFPMRFSSLLFTSKIIFSCILCYAFLQHWDLLFCSFCWVSWGFNATANININTFCIHKYIYISLNERLKQRKNVRMKKIWWRKILGMIMHKVGSRNHYASEMDVLIEH